ncbi:hypothetical protein [Leptospira bandrabouensis]|uniref:hypothetical protein n=1 Tax=Leptospira bandrabouensis TaxID=2484903 RepID=UPI001090BEC7|nr:hypothetical protein [Leptospira bandrabouensis]TGN08586.1 hypothetical protein EHR07_03455 [Leptospira bandrabouensis]
MSEKNHEFEKGYLCATAEIIRTHGEDTIALDVFKGCPMTINEMRKAGIEEFDIEALKPIVKEWRRKEKLKK